VISLTSTFWKEQFYVLVFITRIYRKHICIQKSLYQTGYTQTTLWITIIITHFCDYEKIKQNITEIQIQFINIHTCALQNSGQFPGYAELPQTFPHQETVWINETGSWQHTVIWCAQYLYVAYNFFLQKGNLRISVTEHEN